MSFSLIQKVNDQRKKKQVIDARSGDTVRVYQKIKEGSKERIQMFQGVVLRVSRGTTDATFTVRKVSDGVGVERIFPMHTPSIDRIEVIQQGKVRRARIYFLRNLAGKAARHLDAQHRARLLLGEDAADPPRRAVCQNDTVG